MSLLQGFLPLAAADEIILAMRLAGFCRSLHFIQVAQPRSKACIMVLAPKRTSDNPRVYAMLGYAIIIFTFGILGGWAASAPLSSAVVASGVLNTEGNKKTVQHLEGGIIKQILVHEGGHVTAGQILLRLDETEPKARAEIARNQVDAAIARDARITAELGDGDRVQFPAELKTSDPIAAKAMEDEANEFSEWRATLDGKISILRSRGDELRQELAGIDRERAANEQQVKFIRDELNGVRRLYQEQLVPKTRWLALERERARLEGAIGQAIAEHAKTAKSIGETELQVEEAKQQAQEEASRDLAETREKLRDLRTKFVVAQDILHRLDITAPVTGRIQNLQVFTIGAVIRPGQPLLDIAPDHDKLVIRAHISTMDIVGLAPGKTAEVRFPGFHDRTLPMIAATVESISQDRLMDAETKQPYYLAIVDVPPENIPQKYRNSLISGMNVSVIIPTKDRTMLEFLVEPLRNRVRTAFRQP